MSQESSGNEDAECEDSSGLVEESNVHSTGSGDAFDATVASNGLAEGTAKPVPAWYACPGCARMVTSLVREGPKTGIHPYSFTNCCWQCEVGQLEGHGDDPWSCAGVPREHFREMELRGAEAPAHCLLYDPGPTAAGGEPLPAVLFLHGSMTYLYPETLWWDVRQLVENNSVVAKCFIVVAPFAGIGEPIAVKSRWTKVNRFGEYVQYVKRFDEDLTWATFLGALRSLGPGRVDPARLHVIGYSMGGQACWNIALRHGSHMASCVPMAGCCSWRGDAWSMQDAYLAELQVLPLWSYCGEADVGAVSWRDLRWLARCRGLKGRPRQEPLEQKLPDASLLHYEWSSDLWVGLIRSSNRRQSNHCIWSTIYHNEDAFGLFSRMLGVRCAEPLLPSLEDEAPFPASRRHSVSSHALVGDGSL